MCYDFARMRTIIRSKSIARLTRQEHEQCQALTLSGLSMMRDQLNKDRRRINDSRAIMVIDDDRKEVIAWALIYTEELRGNRIGYFYIHKSYRREGYGRRLYDHAKRLEGTILVCPSNEVNRSFFRALGAQAAPYWYF